MVWRFVTLAVGIALVLGVLWARRDGPDPGAGARSGGVLRIITPVWVDSLDPALAQADGLAWVLEFGTCATLMAYRSGSAPEPEAADARPRISPDGRTYEFTIRPGLRFSDGRPLTATNFEIALRRVLNPVSHSYSASLFADVQRIQADGRRLRIRLRRPAGDLVQRLALPPSCPVPIDFPVSADGVPLLVGSGPFYFARHRPERELIIARNRYYAGPRRARVDGYVMTFAAGVEESIRAVETGQADLLGTAIPPELRPGLVAKYGVNTDGGRLFREEGTVPYPLVLNTSRPLFKDNVALRQAVNFALDREAISRSDDGGATSNRTTDQILSPAIDGWVDHDLYPLDGPDHRRARELAEGNTRGGKAVLYVFGIPRLQDRARVIADNLKEIGLDVTVKSFAPVALDAKTSTPGEPYDMLLRPYQLEYPDPANLMVRLLDGANARKSEGNTNAGLFDDPRYNRRLADAHRLAGPARLPAFSALEADLLRTEAPWAPMWEGSRWLLFSTRVGCVRQHPSYRVDLAALCLR